MMNRIITCIVPGALVLTMLTTEAPETEVADAVPVAMSADQGSGIFITQAPTGQRRRVRRRTRRRVRRRHERREEMKMEFISIESSLNQNYIWSPCLA